MKGMTLQNIAEACNGTYYGDKHSLNIEVTGIVIDSRKITKGCLFIALRGERVDGHSFIPSVMEQGAIGVVSEERLENPKSAYILVDSCALAMQQIAGYYRSVMDIPVVGITGSVGKTSTKEMIASVLKEKYCVHKTAGNFNNEIGLPLTVFDICQEHQVAVLEMGISDFGEMSRLSKIAKPNICVITNIGLCHLENLKTRDGILKAKTEIFESMSKDGTVVLNGDDDKLMGVSEVNGKKPVFYGMKHGEAYVTEAENLGMEGIRMKMHLFGQVRQVTISMPGEHNIYNALAAACVGHELGMTIDEIVRGIESAETIGGRSNFIKARGITVIDDCYNANPVSMKSSLDVLCQAKGRKIAVLGDMGELGEREKELHYSVGEYVGEKNIDILFCAGSLSREIAKGAKSNNFKGQIHEFITRDEMLKVISDYIQEDDTILVKASHFMEFPKVVEHLTKNIGQ